MFVVGGESLVDLVAAPREADGTLRLTAHPGGSPMNCAIALGKLGNATGFLCPISRDPFGGLILEPLAAAGVVPLLRERVAAPTSLAVATLNERGQARYEFYRSADHPLEAPQMLAALPEMIAAYQVGGFCAIDARDAAIWMAVVHEAARRGAVISIDPNVRPSLVEDFEGYRARLDRFLDQAQLIKMSDEDLRVLRPDLHLEAHARALLKRPKAELVVVTFGEQGSMAWSKSGGHATAPIWSPPMFGDTVGAGDSLMAGVLSALNERGALKAGRLAALDDRALADVLRFGAVVAGLNCARKGCVPPRRAEVDAVLATLA